MSRFCIDATPLLLRSAGVKTYLYHLAENLTANPGQHEILLFPYLKKLGRLRHDDSCLGSWATYWRLAYLHSTRLGKNGIIDMTYGRYCDVFHASIQVNHPPRNTLVTSTIHDMTCWLLPETHTPTNVVATKAFGETVMRKAAGLIAVSEATKRDAVELLGLDPQRITVIYHGVAATYFQAAEGEIELARRALGLTRPYVLTVGTVEPRKNLDRLLNAWEQLPADVRDEYELIVSGPVGWQSEAIVNRLRAPGAPWRYVGYLPERLLPGLTAGATIFAYPSLYEGFGFPVAQALAAGVPVVTSAVSSLPEIAGDAGLLVDPMSEAAIREGLLRLLTSPTEREALKSNSRSQSAQFTWERCAEQTLRFFDQIAGRSLP